MESKNSRHDKPLGQKTVGDHISHLRGQIKYIAHSGADIYQRIHGLSSHDAQLIVQARISDLRSRIEELEVKGLNTQMSDLFTD